MDTQLKKGILEMCVLRQLCREDMYGYELMKLIQDVFPDVYDGSIYTILRRLNADGYTQAYMKDVPSGGPGRKYYTVTPDGREYYRNMALEWKTLVERVERLGI